ncbi:RNA-directed DNA polymerase, eukaryota, reverse transcriptase zinc-binding domain protein [Tanacetum coccineum]
MGIVENVLVNTDKFLFPSDFMVMDMLNTHNETMILERPFLATIQAEIDVFNKEISLGIGGDRVTFDMNKKIHNFTTTVGEIYMINSTSNNEYTFHTSLDASSRVEKTDNLHNENNYCNQEQGRNDIWENYKKVLGDNTYWWHDQKSEEEERRELGISIEEYHPPIVHVESFKIKRYSFDSGKNFICVTKELMDALPLGRENEARFKDMIRKEVDSGRKIHRKT